ncbi:hypothetical protein BS78_02G165900 [Paspalum vaginatum]|nr:hypothetical protein BS78_02G165900 [Paspalum vaginatum]
MAMETTGLQEASCCTDHCWISVSSPPAPRRPTWMPVQCTVVLDSEFQTGLGIRGNCSGGGEASCFFPHRCRDLSRRR